MFNINFSAFLIFLYQKKQLGNLKQILIMSLKEELRKMIISNGFNKSKEDLISLMQDIVREIYPVKVGDVVTPTIMGIWDNNITSGKKYIVEKINDECIAFIDDSGERGVYMINRFHILQK